MTINLTELFEVQRKLDAEIEKKHPTAPGEDRLAKRILALQVELGECANEWRGFKFWSMNQEPKTKAETYFGTGIYHNPLLEEYVDCLHFILSIGLEDAGSCVWDWEYVPLVSWDKNITRQFIDLNASISAFNRGNSLEMTIRLFIGLGELLGFTWEQITDAYMSKNKTNWERQANGY